MNYAEIDELITDPVTGEKVQKNVFAVFAHGNELLQKIKKIGEGLGATIYPLDQSPMKRSEDLLEVTARIEDLNHVMFNTQSTVRTELSQIAMNVAQWEIIVKKEKGIFHSMNLFNYDSTRKCLIAEGIPTCSLLIFLLLYLISRR
jgi:V-type H+-transporting ATPase subunit a